MKKIITATMFTLISFLTYAQDRLVKKDKSEIKIKVIEVTDTEIKYKKADNINGPLYSIKKNEVSVVIYAHGQVETFDEVKVEGKKDMQIIEKNQSTGPTSTSGTTNKTSTNIENSFIILKLNINGKIKTGREAFTTHTIDINSKLSGFPQIFNSVNIAFAPDILAGLGFSFYSSSDASGSSTTSFGISARGLYSFNNVRKLPISKYNLYGGLSLNYTNASVNANVPGYGSISNTASDFGVGLIVGGRFTLTGAIAELGFANGGTGIGVGLSFSTRNIILKHIKNSNTKL